MIHPDEYLQRLIEGNRRYADGEPLQIGELPLERRIGLVEEPHPFAVILGCSDSRVPVELVFDQGPGELYVVRSAGGGAGPSEMGSIEYGVERFGIRLVVVLGHSGCGAIQAALNHMRGAAGNPSANIQAIVDRIRSTVEPALHSIERAEDTILHPVMVRAHVAAVVEHLNRRSPLLWRMIRTDGLKILGAEFLLQTGRVEFLAGINN